MSGSVGEKIGVAGSRDSDQTRLVNWELKVNTCAIGVLLANCFVSQSIPLGQGIEIQPLPEPLGLRGELDYVVTVAAPLLGLDLPKEVVEQLRAQVRNHRHVAFLSLPLVEASSIREAMTQLQPLLDKTYDALSFLTTNSVDPFAYVGKDGVAITVGLDLPKSQALAFPIGNRMIKNAQQVHALALQDAKYAVLLRLFRIANQAPSLELRVFHLAQFFDVAAEQMDAKGSSTAERCRSLLRDVGLDIHFQVLPTKLGVHMQEGKDTIDVLCELRNRVAHDGVLDNVSMKAFAQPFLTTLEDFCLHVTFIAQFFLEKQAGVYDS